MRDPLDFLSSTFDSFFGARTTDPETSHEAAEINHAVRRRDRWEVLRTHYDHAQQGLTDFELANITRRQQTSVGKRRGELRDLNLIEQTDMRRPSPSGATAIVWRITDAGRQFIQRG
jgi:hypothetical protein